MAAHTLAVGPPSVVVEHARRRPEGRAIACARAGHPVEYIVVVNDVPSQPVEQPLAMRRMSNCLKMTTAYL